MRALVVYESMFGNTRTIAEGVAEGLSARGVAVEVTEVGQAPPELVREAIDLLVVGAPTHAFGLSRPATRASAVEQAGGQIVSTGGGLREWLDGLPRGRSSRELPRLRRGGAVAGRRSNGHDGGAASLRSSASRHRTREVVA